MTTKNTKTTKKAESSATTIKELNVKAKGRDEIIFELRSEHGLNQKDAQAYYNEYHKGERGDSFVSIFDEFLLEKDRSESDVIEFLSSDEKWANKLKTKSHFISRANFASELRTKLESKETAKK